MAPQWILSKTNDQRFPYRVSVVRGSDVLLDLQVQSRWPGQQGNVFCLRPAKEGIPSEAEIIERVGVVAYKPMGKRLTVTLDRARNKRCDFLFIEKQYKTRPGNYEQIFWRTQSGMVQRRPHVKLSTYRSGQLQIVIDSGERYAWTFGKAIQTKESLPAGDYALRDESGLVAVVERKTFDNLLQEFGRMPSFHQSLAELETYPFPALVIEAAYADFLKTGRMTHYPPAFAARALAEIQAFHPRLPVIFAGNRKLAQTWTYDFFAALQASRKQTVPDRVRESVPRFGVTRQARDSQQETVQRAIREQFGGSFKFSHLQEQFPQISESTLRGVLGRLKKKGDLKLERAGKASLWVKVEN